MDGLNTQLQDLKSQIDELMRRINIESKASQASDLEKQASAPDFWDNPSEGAKSHATLI